MSLTRSSSKPYSWQRVNSVKDFWGKSQVWERGIYIFFFWLYSVSRQQNVSVLRTWDCPETPSSEYRTSVTTPSEPGALRFSEPHTGAARPLRNWSPWGCCGGVSRLPWPSLQTPTPAPRLKPSLTSCPSSLHPPYSAAKATRKKKS